MSKNYNMYKSYSGQSSVFGRALARVLLTVAATLVAACHQPPAKSVQEAPARSLQKPNIVVILVDDLGYSDIGAYNPDTFYETPNIDKLAREGLLFTDGYAANPVCSPSRYGILTGRHPTRAAATEWFHVRGWPHRVEKFRPAEVSEYMPHDDTTLPEALKDAGYRTAFLGKWHLGEAEDYWPEHHGFDINIGGHEMGQPAGGYFSPYENPRLGDGPEGEYLTERLTDEAIRLVDGFADADDPFLLYLSFYTVHTPLQAPAETVAKYEAKGADSRGEGDFESEEQIWPTEEPRLVRTRQNHATYSAMIEHLDRSVGRLLSALEGSAVADNTIVVFTSDNGGLSTAEGSPTSNLPLRGGKGWLYEGGVRVPFIVHMPGAVSNGTVSALPVVSMDLMSTILDLAGLKASDYGANDGRSLVPLLEGRSTPESRPIFFHYPHYSNQGGFPGAAVRDGDWKLIERFEDGHVYLYNLSDDIGEQRDVAGQHPEKVTELVGLLHNWYRETGARFLEPNPERPEFGQPWRPQEL